MNQLVSYISFSETPTTSFLVLVIHWRQTESFQKGWSYGCEDVETELLMWVSRQTSVRWIVKAGMVNMSIHWWACHSHLRKGGDDLLSWSVSLWCSHSFKKMIWTPCGKKKKADMIFSWVSLHILEVMAIKSVRSERKCKLTYWRRVKSICCWLGVNELFADVISLGQTVTDHTRLGINY